MLEGLDEFLAVGETDESHLAATEADIIERDQHSGRSGFVGREDAVDLGAVAVEEIL